MLQRREHDQVPAGTYTEQVTITKSLTLVGEDRDTTIIKAPGAIHLRPDPWIFRIPFRGQKSRVPDVDVDLSASPSTGRVPAVAAQSATASWSVMALMPIFTITRSWISVTNPSAAVRTASGLSSGAPLGAQPEQLRSLITSSADSRRMELWSAIPVPAQRSPAIPSPAQGRPLSLPKMEFRLAVVPQQQYPGIPFQVFPTRRQVLQLGQLLVS